MIDDLKLDTCRVQNAMSLRILKPEELTPAFTGMIHLEKVEEAKAVIPYSIEKDTVYVAFWEEYGCISHD